MSKLMHNVRAYIFWQLGPVGSGLPSIWLSSLLNSPPRVGSLQPGKAGGKRWELDGRRGWHTLRSRVTARHFFWSNRCCMHSRARSFNVDGDMSRFSWPSLALLGLRSSRCYTHKFTPFECRPTLCFDTAQIARYTNRLTTPKSLWCRPNKRHSAHCSAF